VLNWFTEEEQRSEERVQENPWFLTPAHGKEVYASYEDANRYT
jgi:hypothetical protein